VVPGVFVPVANLPAATTTQVNQRLQDIWKSRQFSDKKSIQVRAAA
jgi:hypothetical protein